ncbi:MAG: helix-turn-helix transcriptional regulator [Actinobacteria bacterium]|nr:helix-turn-helix transcriptional regulator [Actinomycetota bacterium]
MDVRGRFAMNVAAARREAGMSREELAQRAGLDRSEIDSIEAGRGAPDLDTLVRLSGALGVSADVLVEGIS